MEGTDTIAEVGTKPLASGDTLYKIKTGTGKELVTKERELAQIAHEAQSTRATVFFDYTEKKSGQYGQFTDRWVNQMRIVDGVAPGIPTPTLPGIDPFLDSEPPPVAPMVNLNAELDLKIAKAVALKAAVGLMPVLPEPQRTLDSCKTMAEYWVGWLLEWKP